MSEESDIPVAKIVVVQTPLGTIKVALPPSPPDEPDPVAVAMQQFQRSVEEGAEDPLMETLTELKRLEQEGRSAPLHVGLLILQQMCDSDMLPPMTELLRGSGVTEDDLHRAKAGVHTPPGLLEKLDDANMN
jgi:hypothetical protein